MKLSRAAYGTFLVFLFDLLSAGKAVYVGHLVQGVPLVPLAFWTFVIAAVFFLALHTPQLRVFLQKIRANAREVVFINCTSAGAWITYFVALKHIEPAIDTALAFGVGPVLTTFFSHRLRAKQVLFPAEKTAAWGVLASMTLMIVGILVGKSSLTTTLQNSLIGIFSALLSGLFVVFHTNVSKRLSERSFTAQNIMAVRFWLLLILCLGLWPVETPFFFMTTTTAWSIGLLSLVGVIIPLFVLQSAIERTEPITVALVLAALPGMALLLQCFDPRLGLSPISIAAVLSSVGFTVYGAYARLNPKSSSNDRGPRSR